jgi:hypothetical protein
MDFAMKTLYSAQAASTCACECKPCPEQGVVPVTHPTPREPSGSGDPGASQEHLSAGGFRSKPRRHNLALLALGLLALSHSACVNGPASIPQSAAGKPEVVIASRDIEEMKSKLLSDMAGFGYQVARDTPDLLEISRPTTDLITAHYVGDASSIHQRVITYTFVRQGVSTRITADLSMRARSSEGRVDTVSLNDNGAVYGFIQNQLDELKKALK